MGRHLCLATRSSTRCLDSTRGTHLPIAWLTSFLQPAPVKMCHQQGLMKIKEVRPSFSSCALYTLQQESDEPAVSSETMRECLNETEAVSCSKSSPTIASAWAYGRLGPQERHPSLAMIDDRTAQTRP